MTSSNELILSNIISVSINTKYQNIPPTEDEFHSEVQNIRTNLVSLYPVTDEEFYNIVDKLRSELVIIMDVGAYIYDTSKPHQSWLPAKRADLDFFFWNRYKKYLELKKSWNPRVTATLDKISDEVVDLLGNPNSEESFQRRGLILGDVQSGKTANYTAICNKAADAGYRIIIVLAGMLENLRQQTQSRLDTEFSGRKSQNFLDPNATSQIKNVSVGVGRFGKTKNIASFTSIEKDFNINTLKSNNLVLKNVTDPILLVVKKNKNILNNLIKWLINNNEDHITGKIMLPMLLIDDEADNASVNTKNPDEDPATINKCIRTLLNSFDMASYLGITATPFANIFIDPESDDEMAGEDLFPRDFIYALSPPSNYIGANQIFGIASTTGILEKIKRDEMDNYFPFSHKKDMDVTELPPSLFEAMSYFLLLNAIRALRGDEGQHSSMMVHISRFTIIQNKIAELINEWLVQVKSDIQNYAALSFVKSQDISVIDDIYQVWLKYDFAEKCSTDWDTIRTTYLHRAVAPIVVKTVNQESGSDSLNYSRYQETGLKVIAVGGE